jgi:hypothetical protein
MRGSDESFTNTLLFGDSPAANGAKPVDADAEARRVDAARAGGAAPAPAAPAGTANAPAPSPDKPADTSKDDDGWLGHLWPF